MRGLCLGLLLILSAGSALAASPPSLECDRGPINKTYGGSAWLVYGCNDNRSLAIISAPGSAAFPFVFFALVSPKDFKLHGEGTGNKAATDAAYKELSALTANDLEALAAQAKTVARHTPNYALRRTAWKGVSGALIYCVPQDRLA